VPRSANRVRIIAGKWRGSHISFPPNTQIRPSSDRLRETLFNWLQTDIFGARCLDLFAGSGVLGLEALSRGAEHIDSVDYDANVVRHLNSQFERFSIPSGQVYHMDYRDFLSHCEGGYDIVFIDPPFNQNMAQAASALLNTRDILRSQAIVYVETHREEARVILDYAKIYKETYVGEVKAELWQKMVCRPSSF
jgi:16S rRNA (guanine966-N2)-methyltransferase